ncbi:MAG: nitroreductase [Anaerolineales bacterium]|nr:MAG: nitroreductase [Anaerolineales bacterium]
MDIFEAIQHRYSIRAYKSEPVEDAKLQQILEAARLAPTASNRQPFHVIVIHTAGKEAELKRIYAPKWFSDAPLVLCVCGTPSEAWVRRNDGKSYCYVDAAIVMDHMILAATALGLGTCWIAAFNPDEARTVLNLPSGVEPVVFTPLGYAADTLGEKRRKEIKAVVKYEHW